jgi:thiol-disulfide isomerase/thioredoxin
MIRHAKALNSAANIALIAASFAVVATSSLDVYSRFHPGVAPAAASTTPHPTHASFPAGAKAPVVPGVDYASSDRTLVLFLSTHCKYCEISPPFYRDLSSRLGNNAARHIVAVFPQTAAEVKMFKEKEKLDMDTVSGTAITDYGVTGTPTLLLVGKDGNVINSWLGAAADPVKQTIAVAFLKS